MKIQFTDTGTHEYTGYAQMHDHYTRRLMRLFRDKGVAVEDRLSDRPSQQDGIDFVVNGGSTVDVKVDQQMFKTGNICLELVSNFEWGTVGCGIKPTKWWAYIDKDTDTVHMVNLVALRSLVANSERKDLGLIWPRTRVGDAYYHTFALLVPFAWVKDSLSQTSTDGRAKDYWSLSLPVEG